MVGIVEDSKMVQLTCKKCSSEAALEAKYLKGFNFCNNCGFNEFTIKPETPGEKKRFKGIRTWIGKKVRIDLKDGKIENKYRIKGGIYFPHDFSKLPKNCIVLIARGVLIWEHKKKKK
jgi:hypothetical protein